MILIDTNYFLQAIIIPKTDSDRAMNEQAQRLFLDLHERKRAAITSDAVIAEVIYVLTGSVYHMRMLDVVDRLRPSLRSMVSMPPTRETGTMRWICLNNGQI